MGCRVWGVVEDRLVEIRVAPAPSDAGFGIEGLPEDRTRTTGDRVRAALLNSGVVAARAPGVLIRLEPTVAAGATTDLDLPLALAALAHAGLFGRGLRWILATGRLGLDGTVHARGLADRPTLADVVGNLCQTPLVQSERMFDEGAR